MAAFRREAAIRLPRRVRAAITFRCCAAVGRRRAAELVLARRRPHRLAVVHPAGARARRPVGDRGRAGNAGVPGADRGGARRRVHVAGGDRQDSQASTTADAPIADSAQRLAAAYAGAVSAGHRERAGRGGRGQRGRGGDVDGVRAERAGSRWADPAGAAMRTAVAPGRCAVGDAYGCSEQRATVSCVLPRTRVRPGLTTGPACSCLTPQWGDRRDSNPRPPGPQPGALPAELRPPLPRTRDCSPMAPDNHSRIPGPPVERVPARHGDVPLAGDGRQRGPRPTARRRWPSPGRRPGRAAARRSNGGSTPARGCSRGCRRARGGRGPWRAGRSTPAGTTGGTTP